MDTRLLLEYDEIMLAVGLRQSTFMVVVDQRVFGRKRKKNSFILRVFNSTGERSRPLVLIMRALPLSTSVHAAVQVEFVV